MSDSPPLAGPSSSYPPSPLATEGPDARVLKPPCKVRYRLAIIGKNSKLDLLEFVDRVTLTLSYLFDTEIVFSGYFGDQAIEGADYDYPILTSWV